MGGGDGRQNRSRRQRDVSAVGTVSKTSRGRRKEEKGGGVYSGQGERTTETVSHTVPNMAAADQFPHQSIARNTRPHTNKILFFPSSFLVLRRHAQREKQQSKVACMADLIESTTCTGKKGNVRRESRIGLWFAPEPRGENVQPMRSVHTEIQSESQTSDRRRTTLPALQTASSALYVSSINLILSDLFVPSKYPPTCVPNPRLLSRSHPPSSLNQLRLSSKMARQQKNIWVAAGDGDLDRVKVGLVVPFISLIPFFLFFPIERSI